MKHKLSAPMAALAVAMIALLVGCGGSSTSAANDVSSTSSPSSEVTTTTAAPGTVSACGQSASPADPKPTDPISITKTSRFPADQVEGLTKLATKISEANPVNATKSNELYACFLGNVGDQAGGDFAVAFMFINRSSVPVPLSLGGTTSRGTTLSVSSEPLNDKSQISLGFEFTGTCPLGAVLEPRSFTIAGCNMTVPKNLADTSTGEFRFMPDQQTFLAKWRASGSVWNAQYAFGTEP